MSHEFETGFFVATPAWHKLGVVLENAPRTAQEAICAAGLDWEVSLRNLFAAPMGDGQMIPLVGEKAVVRESDQTILGVVGAQYQPVQNSQAFNFFDAFVETGMVDYHTAGSLRNGSNVWILAKMRDSMLVGRDQVDKYLLLHNSHDGSKCLSIGLTPIRVVCMNTLSAALSQGKNRLKMKHTRTVNNRLEAAREALEAYNAQFEAAREAYAFLASKAVTAEVLTQYLEFLFPLPKEREGGRNRQVHELVTTLFEGKMLGGSDRSFWSLYNSVTEYSDHWAGGKNADTRLQSIWTGTLAETKQKALDYALQLASAA